MTLPTSAPNPSVFLSYARDDDEPFVRRLYNDLVAAGFTVWFDRVSMPSRGLTFYQEIRDAIAAIDRLVLVVGPKALRSDYVTQEWQFAYFAVNKPVVPIVRLDDQGPPGEPTDIYKLLPEEIGKLHAEDFRRDTEYREHFDLLVIKLRQPLPPVGMLVAVPELPPTYRAQPERLKALRDMLLLDLQGPVVVTGARARVGVHGMGGIGKSVMAIAVAHDPWVRRAFGDNIYWIRFGQTPNVEAQQRWLAKELGDAGEFQDVEPGKERLRVLLADRAILLILDDVWERAPADAFNVIGPRGRILLTTRDSDLVTALSDRGTQYRVELPTEMEAIALLATAAEADPAALPAEAHEIVTRTGRLPLALALCGGMVRGEEGIAWRQVRDALRDHDLEFLSAHHPSEEQHQNAWVAMDVSLRVQLPEQQQRFAELAVFLQGRQVPETAVATLWGHTAQLAPRHAAKLLADFARRSLVQKVRTPDGASARITLHDLLYLFAEGMLEKREGDLVAGQRILLDAYRAVCTTGWASGPDDGYFLQTLVEHLIAAERSEEACALLDGLRWIEARCKAGQAFALLDDYARVLETIPEERERREADRRQEARLTRWGEELASYARAWSDRRDREAAGEVATEPPPLLPDAPGLCRMETEDEINQADQRVIEEPTQLDRLRQFGGFVRAEVYPLDRFGGREAFVAQHVLGRLPSGVVHSSAQELKRGKMSPWLERRWPAGSSTSSRPALLATLEGHTSWVDSVSVTPDGRRAVSGSEDQVGESEDHTLRVWDLASGACLRTLEGHTNAVRSVSVTPDGRRAVSGSHDLTLRVWDLASGAYLRTLAGHTDWIESVSVTPDGRRAVSGSHDLTLRVWDLASGACLRTLAGHTHWVRSVSVTPDGWRAVSGSRDHTLRVWDLASGACLRTLEGHTDWWVRSVSVTPDGRRAVSGSDDRTLRVWDLASGACLRTLAGHTHWVTSVSVTPDGRRAVSGSDDQTLRVWDLASGACLRTLEGHTNTVTSVSVTPDGRRAVSGSLDQSLRVWDLASGACLRTLAGHTHWVRSVSVTPDGWRAVSVSRDHTLRVWDLASGALLSTFVAEGPLASIAVRGPLIVAGTDTGAMLFLDFRALESAAAFVTATTDGSVCCALCGEAFEVPLAVLAAIRSLSEQISPSQSPCLDLPASAFDDSQLLSQCPHCQAPVRFNPFLVDTSPDE